MKLDILFKDGLFKSVERLPDWLKRKTYYANQMESLRDVLGMTQAQLGRRSSMDGRVIRHLESGKANPSLATLEKIAAGLECELVVRFVPKKPLAKILRQRAEQKAKHIVAMTRGSSAMEEQEPSSIFIQFEIRKLTDEFLNKTPSLLWDD